MTPLEIYVAFLTWLIATSLLMIVIYIGLPIGVSVTFLKLLLFAISIEIILTIVLGLFWVLLYYIPKLLGG